MIRIELGKIFWRRVSYLPYAAILVLVGLMILAARSQAMGLRGDVERALAGSSFMVSGKAITAQLCVYVVMPPSFVVFIPLFMALAGGGQIAGELASGTLRTIAVRPVSRTRLFLSKYMATLIYALSITFFLAFAAFAIGAVVFGSGDLVVFDRGLFIYSEGESFGRLALGYALAAVPMFAVVSIAFMFSALSHSPSAAVVIAVSFILISGIIMPIPYFETIRPYLLTNHFTLYTRAFDDPLKWEAIWKSVQVLLAYIGASLIIGWSWFRRRDILC